MLFIHEEDSAGNVRTERLNVKETRSLLQAIRNAQLSQWGGRNE